MTRMIFMLFLILNLNAYAKNNKPTEGKAETNGCFTPSIYYTVDYECSFDKYEESKNKFTGNLISNVYLSNCLNIYNIEGNVLGSEKIKLSNVEETSEGKYLRFYENIAYKLKSLYSTSRTGDKTILKLGVYKYRNQHYYYHVLSGSINGKSLKLSNQCTSDFVVTKNL